MRYIFVALAALVTAFASAGPASSAETVNYTYDALGRVIRVEYIGGPNNGMVIQYTYDPAGNRTRYVTNK